MSLSLQTSETLQQAWRDAWKIPERLKPSEWAERNRVLSTAESSEPGRWNNSRTPYLVGIMDAVCETGVEEIVFVKPTQVGGSETLRNLLGYFIDNDPGPCLIVMPSEASAEEMVRDRIRPLLDTTPALKRHVLPNREDNTLSCIKLDSMPIFTGWAGSPQSLASKPCRYVLPDEIDKYPPFSGREADPLSLAAERTQTFLHRKRIIKTSTPTTRDGAIWKAWEACGDKRRFYVPCPHCGEYQILVFPQVRWPKGELEKNQRADEVTNRKLAYYECKQCAGKIVDGHKPKMLNKGVWLSEGQSIDKNGTIAGDRPKTKKVGFHLNSLYSPWQTFSEIAAEFIRAEGDIGLTMGFRNSRLAEPFEEQVESNRPSEIQIRTQSAPQPCTVPEWAEMVIMTADVQKDLLWYVVRAWGRGFRSQLIKYGRVFTFDDCFREAFETSIGERHQARYCDLICVDGKYRTGEVLEFAARLPSNIFVTQGVTGGRPVMCWDERAEGVQYLKVNTLLSKDRLQQMLSDADPTRWRVHSQIGDDYCQQIASEHKILDPKSRRYVWQPKYKGIANHLFDCEANQCAVANWLGMDAPPEIRTQPRYVQEETQQETSTNFLTAYKNRH